MVRNYAGAIFQHAGVSAQRGGQFLMVLGGAKFGVTGLSIALVDVTGRRPLLLVGIACMAAGMGILAVVFALPPSEGSLLPLAGCALVIAGYAFSYGPLAWLLWAELFPTRHRGEMIGLSSFVANLCMFLNNLWFAPLAAALGSLAPLFGAYCASNLLALALFAWLLPETQGATAEEVRDAARARLGCKCGQSGNAPRRLPAGAETAPVDEEPVRSSTKMVGQ